MNPLLMRSKFKLLTEKIQISTETAALAFIPEDIVDLAGNVLK